MSLRIKLILALAALSALATIGLGVWSYAATADRLHHEIDSSLVVAAHPIVERLGGIDETELDQRGGSTDRPEGNYPFERPRSFEQIFLQILDETGVPLYGPRSGPLPVSSGDEDIAGAGKGGVSQVRNVELDGERYRMLTISVPTGAVQVARSLGETDRLLGAIRNRTLVAVVLVTSLAVLVGWLIARRATSRLIRLAGIAEEVASTGRLDIEVPVTGSDESGRLGQAFNSMLGALARSREDQQRLVQDAGHELRTPLTSLRTNISVLRRYDQLAPETRSQVLDDIDGEARELTALVNELVELASERRSEEPEQVLRLGEVAERAADRVRRRVGREIVLTADATSVNGRPNALDRAIGNLLENAAKFDLTGAPIELSVARGRVQVDDRGPGIAPADLDRVFDRFYRALDARGRPGSGLGLAIVRDVAEQHGGTVFAQARAGGGASVGFVLPVLAPPNLT